MTQRTDESVEQLIKRMDELEEKLEPFTERQRRNHLLHSLRPDIRGKINQQGTEMPQTRQELVYRAIFFEGWLSAEKSDDKPTTLASRITSPSSGKAARNRKRNLAKKMEKKARQHAQTQAQSDPRSHPQGEPQRYPRYEQPYNGGDEWEDQWNPPPIARTRPPRRPRHRHGRW
ncbi:MAG: hypothetical protein M1838_003680 [Thelocarpon superellum]|nr:MAG: hypothetical protein M1838_003680 [Thelocarpon superellum]